MERLIERSPSHESVSINGDDKIAERKETIIFGKQFETDDAIFFSLGRAGQY